jgi:hypothetical protein
MPVVSAKRASNPIAVLSIPLVRLKRAFVPSAVFSPGYPPSGGGLTAWALKESARDTSVSRTRIKLLGRDNRLSTFLAGITTVARKLEIDMRAPFFFSRL